MKMFEFFVAALIGAMVVFFAPQIKIPVAIVVGFLAIRMLRP